jgi:hypothetical protein
MIYGRRILWSAEVRCCAVSIQRTLAKSKQFRQKCAQGAFLARHAVLRPILRRLGHGNRRWLDDSSLDESWDERSRLMARSIQPGSRVVDVGAGAQALRSALPTGCTYVPIDIVQRTPDTIVCDLNRDDLPRLAADYLIASGVLEYITDVDRLIAWMTSVAPRIVLSYETADGETRYHRRKSGWVNDYTEREVCELVRRHDLAVAESAAWRRQTIYWLQRARPPAARGRG